MTAGAWALVALTVFFLAFLTAEEAIQGALIQGFLGNAGWLAGLLSIVLTVGSLLFIAAVASSILLASRTAWAIRMDPSEVQFKINCMGFARSRAIPRGEITGAWDGKGVAMDTFGESPFATARFLAELTMPFLVGVGGPHRLLKFPAGTAEERDQLIREINAFLAGASAGQPAAPAVDSGPTLLDSRPRQNQARFRRPPLAQAVVQRSDQHVLVYIPPRKMSLPTVVLGQFGILWLGGCVLLTLQQFGIWLPARPAPNLLHFVLFMAAFWSVGFGIIAIAVWAAIHSRSVYLDEAHLWTELRCPGWKRRRRVPPEQRVRVAKRAQPQEGAWVELRWPSGTFTLPCVHPAEADWIYTELEDFLGRAECWVDTAPASQEHPVVPTETTRPAETADDQPQSLEYERLCNLTRWAPYFFAGAMPVVRTAPGTLIIRSSRWRWAVGLVVVGFGAVVLAVGIWSFFEWRFGMMLPAAGSVVSGAFGLIFCAAGLSLLLGHRSLIWDKADPDRLLIRYGLLGRKRTFLPRSSLRVRIAAGVGTHDSSSRGNLRLALFDPRREDGEVILTHTSARERLRPLWAPLRDLLGGNDDTLVPVPGHERLLVSTAQTDADPAFSSAAVRLVFRGPELAKLEPTIWHWLIPLLLALVAVGIAAGLSIGWRDAPNWLFRAGFGLGMAVTLSAALACLTIIPRRVDVAFDRRHRLITKRETGLLRRRKQTVFWKNVLALQVCSPGELNLVLDSPGPEAERVRLVAHGNLPRLDYDAELLAEFLRKPLLNHRGTTHSFGHRATSSSR